MTDEFIKLPRLYLNADLHADQQLSPEEGQIHYLRNVLRCGQGDNVRVFNGRDGEWLAAVESAGRKSLALVVTRQIKAQPPVRQAVHLVFSPIRKARMDWLVEKAAELGVSHLHPVVTRFSEVREINGDRVSAQLTEACEQCERLDTPALSELVTLTQFIASWSPSVPIFACLERENVPHLRSLALPQGAAGILIGPEGGFSQEEKAQLSKTAFVKPVSLGDSILRAETAALTALSFFIR